MTHPDSLVLLIASAHVAYLQFLWMVCHGKPKDLQCSVVISDWSLETIVISDWSLEIVVLSVWS